MKYHQSYKEGNNLTAQNYSIAISNTFPCYFQKAISFGRYVLGWALTSKIYSVTFNIPLIVCYIIM